MVRAKGNGARLDAVLLDRVRSGFSGKQGVVEKRMFGGVIFLLGGNISVGVHGAEMIVRTSAECAERALEEPYVRPFDLGGRPLKGWLLVSAQGTTRDKDLERWLQMGSDFARSLPS